GGRRLTPIAVASKRLEEIDLGGSLRGGANNPASVPQRQLRAKLGVLCVAIDHADLAVPEAPHHVGMEVRAKHSFAAPDALLGHPGAESAHPEHNRVECASVSGRGVVKAAFAEGIAALKNAQQRSEPLI